MITMQPPKTMICIRCLEEKPFEKFVVNKPSRFGRMRWCGDCQTDYYNYGGNKKHALKRDGYKCIQCGISEDEHVKKFNVRLSVDHIDGRGRRSKNPNHDLNNLQTLCLSCHGSKDGVRGKGILKPRRKVV